MNMQKKAPRPVRAIALASALTLALCAPATAFAEEPATSNPGTATAADTPTSTITGTIHATTLKATVPTKVSFNIDPGATQGTKADGGTQKRGQYTSPSKYTIENYSAVDVYGYVSGVSVDGATLVNKVGELSKTNGDTNAANVKVMVGLSSSDDDMDLNDITDWLMSDVADYDGKRYFAFNKTADANNGKLLASDNAPDDMGGSATMHVYGAVKNGGWAEGDSFTVKPVFKITATKPA